MNSTLLLSASYEPLRVISWQKAVTLSFLGKVEIVEEYDREIHSVSLVIKMPAVVRLLRYVQLRRREPPLTRVNLLARDGFSCQYCGISLSYTNATIEHIVPRSKGGQTTWENVAAACGDCNRKKGARTPAQAGMALRTKPIAPQWLPVLSVHISNTVPSSWTIFLGGKEKA